MSNQKKETKNNDQLATELNIKNLTNEIWSLANELREEKSSVVRKQYIIAYKIKDIKAMVKNSDAYNFKDDAQYLTSYSYSYCQTLLKLIDFQSKFDMFISYNAYKIYCTFDRDLKIKFQGAIKVDKFTNDVVTTEFTRLFKKDNTIKGIKNIVSVSDKLIKVVGDIEVLELEQIRELKTTVHELFIKVNYRYEELKNTPIRKEPVLPEA